MEMASKTVLVGATDQTAVPFRFKMDPMVVVISINTSSGFWGLCPNYRSWRPGTPEKLWLADAGELLPREHVDDAAATDTCSHEDEAGMFGSHLADEGSVGSEGMGSHGGQDGTRIAGRDNGDKLAFVGDVEGIQTKDLARTLDFFADRDSGLLKNDPGA